MVKSIIYSAIVLASTSLVFGFEYKEHHHHHHGHQKIDIKASALEPSSAEARNDDYCLVFEDHFNTFNFKNWQVNFIILILTVVS
jgi:hypothetical protein